MRAFGVMALIGLLLLSTGYALAVADTQNTGIRCSYGVIARYGPKLPEMSDTVVTLLIVLTTIPTDTIIVPHTPGVLLCTRPYSVMDSTRGF